jgi:hypothetical protein
MKNGVWALTDDINCDKLIKNEYRGACAAG